MKKVLFILLSLFILAICHAEPPLSLPTDVRDTLQIPWFENFVITTGFIPKPRAISNWQIYPEAQRFRSTLTRRLRHMGPNFASQYTVVSLGCGAMCQTNWIINRATGQIVGQLQSQLGIAYRLNSRLLIVNPFFDEEMRPIQYPNSLKLARTVFYQIESDQLTVIHSRPLVELVRYLGFANGDDDQ